VKAERDYKGQAPYFIADKSKCINCGICNKVCPMELPVKEIINHPDCIKCGRCIKACPKNVLSF